MNKRVYVLSGISNHRVTSPPRLVTLVPAPDRSQHQPTVPNHAATMKWIAVATGASLALWSAILGLVF